ncbi:putative OmpA family outer membrane protein [Flavobacterium enshiense DK69]|uniref:Membrane protein n=1 Tax=Flavobacterium enshiense DK69 TaxID=1107311 RepID=V6SD72_9FLAO|nr:OmpA family protein [Flavobacterium enshiense]ESU24633.1 putative OmpA family outer membrane protein [Flavobacterium enshiense DK69]KGO95500.1 membrane protein [Flavobacterium enshiense DK69]
MKKVVFLLLLFTRLAYAQEEVVHSVYFEFDKYILDDKQANEVVAFVKAIDTSRIESVQIYGYCDDRGKDAYNYKLSSNRANTIKNKLIEKGIKNKIIITIEGKGRILIDDDIVDNLPEVRQKNRRVDVVMNFKPVPPKPIPGVYKDIKKDLIVGDRIYLEKIFFDNGSSKLTSKSKLELDRIARILHKYKNIQFEIQGHICCTPTFQKEAIDKDTRKRMLSINRAEAVYKYLIFKRIEKSRMTFKGYGNTRPLGNGPDQDRRVEFVITKI